MLRVRALVDPMSLSYASRSARKAESATGSGVFPPRLKERV